MFIRKFQVITSNCSQIKFIIRWFNFLYEYNTLKTGANVNNNYVQVTLAVEHDTSIYIYCTMNICTWISVQGLDQARGLEACSDVYCAHVVLSVPQPLSMLEHLRRYH